MQNIHEPDDDEVDDDNPPSKSSKTLSGYYVDDGFQRVWDTLL